MKFANIKELKTKTSELIETANTGEMVIITYRGKPRAILKRFSKEEIEDYALAHHPEIRRSIEEAYKDYKKHGGIKAEDIISELKSKIED